MRLLADEDLNEAIASALRRRLGMGDQIVSVRQVPGLAGAADPMVLEIAASQGRLLLTHDRQTMLRHAGERVRQALPMPGVIVAVQGAPVQWVVEDVLLIMEATTAAERADQVFYVPYPRPS